MTERVDTVVVGAGAVGLAVARELASRGHEVLVLEKNHRIGEETSARNSEVVHAGLYYDTHSLKARLCVRGRDLLYAYCERRGVEYRRVGKLIVATSDSQLPALLALGEQARRNGVDDVALLEASAARDLEPEVSCVAALWSPSTGIVDSHGYMTALTGDLEFFGGTVAARSKVERVDVTSDGFLLRIRNDESTMELLADRVVNSAGLHACALASRIIGLDSRHVPPAYFAKGNYFSLGAHRPFRHLVYPLPEAAGLGVHATLDLAGQVRFGPDVQWLTDVASADAIDYGVDPERARRFYPAIRAYWPGLREGDLQPAYSGVRPKIAPPGGSADFLIQGPAAHGLRGLVNLFGIESPGLTSSLAIAEDVAAQLG